MALSIIQIIGALGVVIVTTAAVSTCGNDSGASPASQRASAAATGGPGLPADFPLAPGLSACHPIVITHEVICEWHGVDTPAVYDFYHDALPRAGYTLSGDKMDRSAPHQPGQLPFKKGNVSGAVLVIDSDLKIEAITPP